ncbi:MFS general substrate transporter [Trametes sanguinea]|nr:MFS general substrate transporter [Trametes sanguinea]
MFQIMVAIGVMLSYFINLGISLYIKTGYAVWRIPFGFQLVLAGLMVIGLLTITESPRWLASQSRLDEALASLSFLRRRPPDNLTVCVEIAEIEAALEEEREARNGLAWKEVFFGRGNFIRFVIAVIFSSLGYTGTSNTLLASGIYGIVQVVTTAIFVCFLADTLGRTLSLLLSSFGMGILFFVIGALLKSFPPPANASGDPPAASKVLAAMLYLYVLMYSLGCGPILWVYVADIFPVRARHYGLAVARTSQWLFNFVVAKVTPTLEIDLGYKLLLTFATIHIDGMALFSSLIPETKGRSLEEMDVIFGSVQENKRRAGIAAHERALGVGGEETVTYVEDKV